MLPLLTSGHIDNFFTKAVTWLNLLSSHKQKPAMRKPPYSKAFIATVYSLLLLFILLINFSKPSIKASTAERDYPEQTQTLPGGEHLWESLLKQFVAAPDFK